LNINKNINKLLYALKQKGQVYKINSFKFYSERNEKYTTKYQILKKELVEVYNFLEGIMEFKEKYIVKEECYSKIDLMKYLIDEYKEGEADGK